MAGHREHDFIQGGGNISSGAVPVELTRRLELPAWMDDATTAAALAGFSARPNLVAARLRGTFNDDQGKEMSRHVDTLASSHKPSSAVQ